MARKSAAALSLVPASKPGDRAAVPQELSAAEGALWREVVDAKPADWFTPDNLPVLKEYVRAAVACDLLSKKITAAMDSDDAVLVKLFLDMRDKESRRAVSTATKLRLTQQSRYTAQSASTATKRVSGKRPWQN